MALAYAVLSWDTGGVARLELPSVPDGVYAALSERAREQGQSLEQFVLAQLVVIAKEPTMDEVLSTLDGLDI